MTPFLEKHDIDSYLRAKIVDWMISVFKILNLEESTYFVAVELMDEYLLASL